MRDELETEQRLQHIDPPNTSGHGSASFSFFWAAQPGAWGPSLSAEIWNAEFKTLRSNRLELSVNRVISLFYAHSIQTVDSQGYPLTSSTGCTCYLHRCISYLTAWPGRKSICNTWSFSHCKTTSLGEGKIVIQTTCTELKHWLCVASCPWRRGWVSTLNIKPHLVPKLLRIICFNIHVTFVTNPSYDKIFSSSSTWSSKNHYVWTET